MADSSANMSKQYSFTMTQVEVTGTSDKSEFMLVIKAKKANLRVEQSLLDICPWTGTMTCLPTDEFTIKVYRQRPGIVGAFSSAFPVASISRTVSELLKTRSPLQDQKKVLNVQFTFSLSTSTMIKTSHDDSTEAQQSNSIEQNAESLQPGYEDAISKLAQKKVLTEKLGNVYKGIKVLQSIASALEDLHPAIKVATSALDAFIKACERQEECRDAAARLLGELEFFVQLQGHVPELGRRPIARAAVQKMLLLVSKILEYISTKTDTSATGDLISLKYKDKIEEFREQFATARSTFDSAIGLEILTAVINAEETLLLEKYLSPVTQVHYRQRVRCMDGTRATLLANIQKWIQCSPTNDRMSDIQSQNIFWLTGFPGAGKSSVAGSVATIVATHLTLPLSYFFCKRGDPSLSTAANILPTLAYSICEQDSMYREAILRLLRSPDRKRLEERDIATQFDLLFRKPFTDMGDDEHLSHVIVIDALDECLDKDTKRTMAVYLSRVSQAASWFKVFVTSRQEDAITSSFANVIANDNKVNISDDVSTNDYDIRIYATKILSDWKISSGKLGRFVDQLVLRSAGLFIWCSTLFKNIKDSLDKEDDIEHFLSATVGEDRFDPLKQLYELYEEVLDTAVVGRRDRFRMRLLLGIVLILERPLSCSCLARFMTGHANLTNLNERTIRNIVQSLQAVLIEDTNDTQHRVVRTHHPSFLDYLKDRFERTREWRQLMPQQFMAERCLSIMLEQLKFNVCNLDYSLVLNKDIPHLADHIENHISEELQYSCELWTTHLEHLAPLDCEAPIAQYAKVLVCTPKVLFWLEVMSLLGLLSRFESMLAKCARIFQSTSEAVVEASTDLRRFVSSFSEAMASVPHIYLSALTWLPTETSTCRNIARLFSHHPLIAANREKRWDALIWSKHTGGEVRCLACSPDGCHVICSFREVLQIRDAQTGDLVGKVLKGHSRYVTCVAYSPDGRYIVSGSDDHTLQQWDAHTGDAVGKPLRGHQEPVMAVAYSPDGLYFVSASSDWTLRRWNAQTRELVGRLFEGHTDGVRAVSYSPDGKYIASGSDDHTLRIWDVETSEVVGAPLQGHSGGVNAVSYSPDGRHIASGSDDETVRRWDTTTCDAIGKPLHGHTDRIWAVAYSPNSQYIVSCSKDETLRQWNAVTGEALGDPLKGHSETVRAVAYTPDGRHILSGSWDQSLRCWDVQSGVASAQHEDSSTSTIAYSRDGIHIACGSSSGTLQIRDAKTGAAIGRPLRGHTDAISAVAYSSDGKHIVSGAHDGIIRQWDARTGEVVGDPFQGHRHSILAVTYSPDGRHIGSASKDGTVRRWDALTGKAVGEPLRGHEGWIRAVAYSPDGKQTVSESDDGTLRRWDTETSAAVGEPRRGHTDWVRAVAYSPDGQFTASDSDDRTLRLWDAETGRAVGKPLWADNPVTSLAFSPDNHHIAYGTWTSIGIANLSVFHSTSSTHPGLPLRGLSTTEDRDALWHASCVAMLESDGWVKDGDTLLLWVPPNFRADLRSRILYNTRTQQATPTVDFEKLFQYASDWHNIWTN